MKQNIPEAMTSHDRNNISFDSSPVNTANYNVACSSNLVAAMNHSNANSTLSNRNVNGNLLHGCCRHFLTIN